MENSTPYDELSRALNSSAFSAKAFAEGFDKEHRTLQQKAISEVVFPMIEVLAKDHEQGHTDARNETAAEMCAVIKKALKDHYGYDVLDYSLPRI